VDRRLYQRSSPLPYYSLLWEPSRLKRAAAPILVSSRELIPETPDAGYLTHSLFSYPPHSIPHVLRFFAHLYASGGRGDRLFYRFGRHSVASDNAGCYLELSKAYYGSLAVRRTTRRILAEYFMTCGYRLEAFTRTKSKTDSFSTPEKIRILRGMSSGFLLVMREL
jgi:hypothetical protein